MVGSFASGALGLWAARASLVHMDSFRKNKLSHTVTGGVVAGCYLAYLAFAAEFNTLRILRVPNSEFVRVMRGVMESSQAGGDDGDTGASRDRPPVASASRRVREQRRRRAAAANRELEALYGTAGSGPPGSGTASTASLLSSSRSTGGTMSGDESASSSAADSLLDGYSGSTRVGSTAPPVDYGDARRRRARKASTRDSLHFLQRDMMERQAKRDGRAGFTGAGPAEAYL